MKFRTKLAATTALIIAAFSIPAFAASDAEREKAWDKGWKVFDAEKEARSDKYGEKCEGRFSARGEGNVGLGITQVWAKLRTERHWHEAALKLYGADYASWSKARDKDIACEAKDNVLHCKATATACK